jgi:hypothetical protein
MPTYINEVLKFDLKSNGFMSCLPYILSFFVINTASILNDYLLKRKLVSKTVLRKIYTGIGNISIFSENTFYIYLYNYI